MRELFEDTIAAVSTAPSPAGIAIVRMSGPHAFEIADRVYAGRPGKMLSRQKGNTIHYGWIRDPESGERIDEVLAAVLKAPHSYTGEDTVEIDCHGGVLVSRKILSALLHAGARAAEPGEFSKRAFLNGRMDLSQAEAVMDIIHAENEAALTVSERQLRGSVSEKISAIRKALLHETAHIEAALDDPEHIDMEGFSESLKKIVLEQKEKIRNLIKSGAGGRLLRDGIKTVILGKPNAGKSSLLNALAGREIAIVTDIAGTTRDILENQIDLGGVFLRILDTAGIRDTEDEIERIGVRRALEQAEDADLILFVADSSVPLDENDRKILETVRGRKTIILLNKNDLSACFTEQDLREYSDAAVLSVSARTENGLDQLKSCIQNLFFEGGLPDQSQICITGARHLQALEEADGSLDQVLISIADGMPEDFYSIDLTAACDALGRITGENVSEDLIDEIFSGFCLGK